MGDEQSVDTLSDPSSLEPTEEFTKNLDDEEHDEPDRNSAAGFSVLTPVNENSAY